MVSHCGQTSLSVIVRACACCKVDALTSCPNNVSDRTVHIIMYLRRDDEDDDGAAVAADGGHKLCREKRDKTVRKSSSRHSR